MVLISDFRSGKLLEYILNAQLFWAINLQKPYTAEKQIESDSLELLRNLNQDRLDELVIHSRNSFKRHMFCQHIFVTKDLGVYEDFSEKIAIMFNQGTNYAAKTVQHEEGHYSAALQVGFPSPFFGVKVYSEKVSRNGFHIQTVPFVNYGIIPAKLSSVEAYREALIGMIEGGKNYLSANDINMLAALKGAIK